MLASSLCNYDGEDSFSLKISDLNFVISFLKTSFLKIYGCIEGFFLYIYIYIYIYIKVISFLFFSRQLVIGKSCQHLLIFFPLIFLSK
jgi:hypothetical protein